jgi:tellurite resistance protein
MATTLQSLHQEFKEHSENNLSAAEFETLLVFFPAILVVAADGDIDHEEWIYINQLIKAMANYADEDKAEKLEEEYEQAIKFLIRELHTWEASFIPILQELLNKDHQLREEVTEVLYIVADASDGVSAKEKKVLNQLKAQLALDLDVENL